MRPSGGSSIISVPNPSWSSICLDHIECIVWDLTILPLCFLSASYSFFISSSPAPAHCPRLNLSLEVLGVESDVLGRECRNEVIRMVVSLLHPDHDLVLISPILLGSLLQRLWFPKLQFSYCDTMLRNGLQQLTIDRPSRTDRLNQYPPRYATSPSQPWTRTKDRPNRTLPIPQEGVISYWG